MSFNQALQAIERGGGQVEGEKVTIVCQQPKPVRYEKAFERHYPAKKINIHKDVNQSPEIGFDGIWFVVKGAVRCDDQAYVASVEVYLNGQWMETAKLPANYTVCRHELTWKYQLPKGKHKVSFKWLNPKPGAGISISEAVIYSDAPAVHRHPSTVPAS
jgi:hypothetical protein